MLYKYLLAISFVFILLRPHFNFNHPIIKVFFGDLVLMILVIITLLFFKLSLNNKYKNLLIYSLTLIIFLVLITYFNMFKGVFYFELLSNLGRIVYYFIMLWFFVALLEKIKNPLNKIDKLVNIAFIIIIIVGFVQLLNPPIMGDLIKLLYGSDKLRDIWSGYPRVYSTFMNANWFGVAIVFFASYFVSVYKLKMLTSRSFSIKIICVLSLLIISASRTALIGFMVLMLFQIVKAKSLKYLSAYSITVVVLFGALNYLSEIVPLMNRALQRTTGVVQQLFVGEDTLDSVIGGRYIHWQESLDLVIKNPIIGYGGSVSIPHNAYLSFLLTFGLIGFILVLFFIILTMLEVRKNFNNNTSNSVIREWLINFTIPFLVMSLAADLFFSTQVMLLYVFILSSWFSSIYKSNHYFY